MLAALLVIPSIIVHVTESDVPDPRAASIVAALQKALEAHSLQIEPDAWVRSSTSGAQSELRVSVRLVDGPLHVRLVAHVRFQDCTRADWVDLPRGAPPQAILRGFVARLHPLDCARPPVRERISPALPRNPPGARSVAGPAVSLAIAAVATGVALGFALDRRSIGSASRLGLIPEPDWAEIDRRATADTVVVSASLGVAAAALLAVIFLELGRGSGSLGAGVLGDD